MENTKTKYTEQQAKEFAKYMDLYYEVRRLGIAVGISSLMGEDYREEERNYAIKLRKALTEFQEGVPREIQEHLSGGIGIGELESLATNTLLKDLPKIKGEKMSPKYLIRNEACKYEEINLATNYY